MATLVILHAVADGLDIEPVQDHIRPSLNARTLQVNPFVTRTRPDGS